MDRKTKIVGLTFAVLLIAVLSFQVGGIYERQTSLVMDVGTNSVHVTVWIQRVGEEPMYWDHHAGVLTTIGLNYIEGLLGNNAVDPSADWISLSTDVGSPAAGWTQIPTEIASGGLERASGAYVSTGDGVWTIEYQFTASATHTDVQLCGFQWAASGDSNLMWADTFTPVTLNDGDKLTITGTVTVT